MGHSESAKRCGTFRMDYALRNPLSIEVGELFHQVEILHQDRTPIACCQRVLVISNGNTIRSCECFKFSHDDV